MKLFYRAGLISIALIASGTIFVVAQPQISTPEEGKFILHKFEQPIGE